MFFERESNEILEGYYDYMRSVFQLYDDPHIFILIYHIARRDDPEFLREMLFLCDWLLSDSVSAEECADFWAEITDEDWGCEGEALYQNIFVLKFEAGNHLHKLLTGEPKYTEQDLLEAYNAFAKTRGYRAFDLN